MKKDTVNKEMFQDCGSANSLIDGSITIQMYIVDNNGKLDIPLTTDASYVISKGFQKSNYLKSKVGVKCYSLIVKIQPCIYCLLHFLRDVIPLGCFS